MTSLISRLTSRHVLILALLLALTAVAGCGGDGDDGEGSAKQSVTDIRYATSFGTFGRDAYAYVAKEKGFFKEAGFNVEIVPGAGSADVAKLIGAGRLDYGPLDFNALVVARGNEGIPVKIVSFVHQNALTTIMARGDSGISEPADLAGKTIADSPGSTTRIMFPLYAQEAGIDPDSVTFRPADPATLPSLLAAKRVDAVGQFVVGEPLFELATKGPVTQLPYAEFLPDLPGLGIAASDDKIAEDPEEVRRFVAALNKGLEYAVENPEEAAEILRKAVPETNAEIAAQELEIMREYVLTDYTKTNGLGSMDKARLDAAVEQIAEAFELDSPPTVDDVYAPGFLESGS